MSSEFVFILPLLHLYLPNQAEVFPCNIARILTIGTAFAQPLSSTRPTAVAHLFKSASFASESHFSTTVMHTSLGTRSSRTSGRTVLHTVEFRYWNRTGAVASVRLGICLGNSWYTDLMPSLAFFPEPLAPSLWVPAAQHLISYLPLRDSSDRSQKSALLTQTFWSSPLASKALP